MRTQEQPLTIDDVIVERVPHSGAFIVSTITGGYRVARTYYFYEMTEAVELFLSEMNGGTQ